MSETVEQTALAVVPAALLPTILANDKDDILGKLSRKVATFKPDVTTNKGRAEMRSLAAEIASAKMDLIRIGKGLTEGWRKSTKAVNEECNLLEERMNALRDKVRQQLTDFENAEKARTTAHEEAIAAIEALAVFEEAEPTPQAVQERLDSVERLPAHDWQEFKNRAAQTVLATVTTLTGALALANKRAADAAELVRLRAEEDERQRIEAERLKAEREARIAAEAAEAARIEAERIAAENAAEALRLAQEAQEKIEAAARAAAEAAEAERQRVIRQAQEAEERAVAMERGKIEAERKAQRDAEEAQAKLDAQRLQAEKNAAIERERQERARKQAEIEAVAAEQRRQADATAAEETERRKREENKAHRTKINREAVTGIMLALSEVHKGTAEEGEEYARAIVTALAKGLVSHCRIEY